jgi:transcriptional regulator with XRE-family HTH domain
MRGKELRAIRQKLGWTQVRFAKAIGVTSNTVARWERDELAIREPTVKLAKMIHAAHTTKKGG